MSYPAQDSVPPQGIIELSIFSHQNLTLETPMPGESNLAMDFLQFEWIFSIFSATKPGKTW